MPNNAKLSKYEIAAIKRHAKNIALIERKKNRLEGKIDVLQEELKGVEAEIAEYEAFIDKNLPEGTTYKDFLTEEIKKEAGVVQEEKVEEPQFPWAQNNQ